MQPGAPGGQPPQGYGQPPQGYVPQGPPAGANPAQTAGIIILVCAAALLKPVEDRGRRVSVSPKTRNASCCREFWVV